MSYDFNTANALSVVYTMLKQINKDLRDPQVTQKMLEDDYKTLSDMLDIFGIKVEIEKLTQDELEVVKAWNEARRAKNFEEADKLRAVITEKGIRL